MELPEEEQSIFKDWLQKDSMAGTVISFSSFLSFVFLYLNSVLLCSVFCVLVLCIPV